MLVSFLLSKCCSLRLYYFFIFIWLCESLFFVMYSLIISYCYLKKMYEPAPRLLFQTPCTELFFRTLSYLMKQVLIKVYKNIKGTRFEYVEHFNSLSMIWSAERIRVRFGALWSTALVKNQFLFTRNEKVCLMKIS